MDLEQWSSEQLFSSKNTAVYEWLCNFSYPWEALTEIGNFINAEIARIAATCPAEYEVREGNIYIHKTSVVHESVVIKGPCIIGAHCELRPNAYIRGNVYVGADSVLGNSCEFKNAILMDNAEIPHFSYVGDSILGSYTHFGAGAIVSNFREDRASVKINLQPGEKIETGLRKFGVITGDHVEIGAGTVLNPGTLIGRGSRIYPLTSVRYAVAANMILKSNGELQEIR